MSGRAVLGLVVLTGLTLAPAVAGAQQTVGVQGRAHTVRAADGWLGLSVLERVRVEEGRTAGTSVVITKVAPGGPADRAGLRAGDRVVRVNGRTATPAVFNRIASSLAPDDAMQVAVERPGIGTLDLVLTAATRPRELTILLSPSLQARVDSSLHRLDSVRVRLVETDSTAAVRLGAALRDASASIRRDAVVVRTRDGEVRSARGTGESTAGTVEFEARPLLPWVEGRSWVAGARFTPLNPELASYFEVRGGLLVTEVIDGTPLPQAGMRPGDVIVEAGGRGVRSIEDLREMLSRPDGPTVPITVVRHGERVKLRLGG